MPTMTRRQLLQAAGAGAAAFALSPLATFAAEGDGKFTLPKLPYAYDALEPHIDAETMKIHHDLHHGAYVANLNKALEGQPDIAKKGIVAILRDADKLPQDIRQAVINNGGGHANHTMFWEIMGKANGKASAELTKAINDAFESMDKLTAKINDAGAKRFGSGWAWLILDKGKLDVISTANQDSPFMKGQFPILGVDVWEHAYYLKYKNKRPDYLKAWWNVVNWDTVSERYNRAVKASK